MTMAHWIALGLLVSGVGFAVFVHRAQQKYRMNLAGLFGQLYKMVEADRIKQAIKMLNAASTNLSAQLLKPILASADRPWRLDYWTHVALRRAYDEAPKLRLHAWAIAAVYAGLILALIPLWGTTASVTWLFGLVAMALLFVSGAAFGSADTAYKTTIGLASRAVELRNRLYQHSGYVPPTVEHIGAAHATVGG